MKTRIRLMDLKKLYMDVYEVTDIKTNDFIKLCEDYLEYAIWNKELF